MNVGLQETRSPLDDFYFEFQEQVALRRRLEDKLAFLEEYNRHLVESSGACIMLVNEEGLVQSLNRRARDLLEIAEHKNCLNVLWTSLFHDLDAKAVPAMLNAKMGCTFQASSRTLFGETKYWTFTFSGIGGAEGKKDRFLIIGRDITEQIKVEKALRQSEEAFRKIFEENPIGILLTNLD